MEDTCCCIAMHSLTERRNPNIEYLLPEAGSLLLRLRRKVFPYNKRVVAIVKIWTSQILTYFDIQRRIGLLRDGLMKAVSASNTGILRQLDLYFQQACWLY